MSIQLFGAIAWLIIERPDIREIYPYPLTAVLTCRVSTFSLIMSLVYNMVLIILCTWYAFKTRKIPENFNEAKYIGFTMYSTCIVWLAFLPIYFGTNNDYKVTVSCTLKHTGIPTIGFFLGTDCQYVYVLEHQRNSGAKLPLRPESLSGHLSTVQERPSGPGPRQRKSSKYNPADSPRYVCMPLSVFH